MSQTEAYAGVSHRRAYEYLKAYREEQEKKGSGRAKAKPEKKAAKDAGKGAA